MAVGGAVTRELRLVISANTAALAGAMGSAGKAADGFAAKLRRGVGRAAPYAAVGLAAVAFQARQGVQGVMEDEKALANLESTLKATGNAANVTSDGFFKYANELQRTTGTSAAAITQGAALLGTFDKVRDAGEGQNAIFTRATAAALDLSKKGFGSLESSNKMLGKALQDPVRGIGALNKAGVDFTKQQREQIKALVESGDVLGAQRIIMERVEGQVKGTAEAYGKTTEGQLEIGKRAWEELQKSLALSLLPVIQSLAGALARLSVFLQNNQTAVKVAVIGFTALASAVLALRAAFAVAGVIGALANPITAVIVAAAALAAGLIYLYKNSETARRIMTAAFNAVRAVVVPAINTIRAVIQTFLAFIRGDFTGVINGVKAIVSNAFGAIPGLILRVVSGALGAAKRIGAAVWDGIKQGAAVLSQLPSWLLGKIAGFMRDLPGKVLTAFKAVGKAIVDGIRQGVSDAWDGLKSWVANKVRSLPGGNLILRAANKVMNEMGRSMAREMSSGFEQSSQQMFDAVPAAFNAAILQARTNLASLGSGFASMLAQARTASVRAAFGADSTDARDQYDRERAAREQLMVDRQRMELQEARRTARTRADRARAEQALADFEAEQNLARLEQAARAEEALIASRDREAAAAGEKAQADVNNLIARFNKAAISADEFRAELTKIIGADTGKELGDAFAFNFDQGLKDVQAQLAEFAEEMRAVFGLAPGSVISPANIAAELRAEATRKQSEEQAAAAAAANVERNLGPWPTAAARDKVWKSLAPATRRRAEKTTPGRNKYGIKIKPLADGGILRRAVLAGEAGPEAVIPLTGSLGRNALARAMEDAAEAAGTTGGTVINLTVHGVMATDVRQFAARLRPELDRVITARY